MENQQLRAILNLIAAGAALTAAVLWYLASIAVVRPSGDKAKDGWESSQIVVDHKSTGEFDPFATAIKQSGLNKWAALAASVAAALQGVALLVPA